MTAAPGCNDPTDAWLRLIRAPGLGGHYLRPLLERFGDSATVLGELLRHPQSLALPTAAHDWLRRPDQARLASDRHWLEQPGHHLLTWTDPAYPALLRDMATAPVALFVRGDPGVLWQPQIAMVGSRNPTAGGRDNARAFAAVLGRGGLAVTSGLAAGIDGAAHEGALDAGAATIAVIGTGPDSTYPAANRTLADRIADAGAVVSEFAPGTPARPQNFPQRNRIIAGLSLGTLVVEAALRSGSLITARLASESGREIFALPGSIHNPMARGCHRLIRDGAKLVETAAEIVEELRPMAMRLGDRLRNALLTGSRPDSGPDRANVPTAGQQGAAGGHLADPDYQRLWLALGHDPVAVDVLAERTGLTAPAISSMLMIMELDGLVVVGANGRYGRADRTME